MIGKAKSNQSLAATIEYNLKEKAELFYANKLIGETIEDHQMQMHDLQRCYQGYAKQLTIHAILSPHITQGSLLTKKEWEQIADEYLEQMNLKEHQAIGFIHSDKEHRHLHLVINKVNGETFKLYHDGFIGKRTQKAADEIARKMGLIRAMEIRRKNIQNRQQGKLNNDDEKSIKPLGSKQLFRKELKTILVNKNIKTVDDYFNEIRKAGFKVLPYKNKETKELRGYGIEKNKTKLDASTIGREFTLRNLSPVFENNNKRLENNQAVNIDDKLSINIISTQENEIENIEYDNEAEQPTRQWRMRW